jgi:hypothetical protein
MKRGWWLLASAAIGAGPAMADEGMWLPSQTRDIARELREAGLELDPATLGDLKRAPLTSIVSLGGCSAAFLSPQGLIATNHHCVYGSIQYNSSAERNYLRDGFLAATPGDEVPAAPGGRVFVIEDLRNVTADMLRGAANLTGEARAMRMEGNRKALIAKCEAQPNRRCDVRAYFGGQAYWLQQQLEIQDVRLVYAPAGGVGNFGGEIDNWMWPRHTGDFGFYRAYVAPDGSSAPFAKDNVPYRPKAFLPIAKDGPKEGDFVMVAGFPGTTERGRTASETRFWYETLYPLQQRLLTDYADAIDQATAGDDAKRITYASIRQGADNYKKKIAGQLTGAETIGLIEKKEADEAAFRQWVAADAVRNRRYGAAIAELDTLTEAANRAQVTGAKAGVLTRAQLYNAARTAYIWAKERAKPDSERRAGFQDRDRRTIEAQMTAIERRFDPAIDRMLFERALAEYRTLPADSRNAGFERALEEIGLDAMYRDTRLADTKARMALLDQPASAFEASTDPFVRLAVAAYAGDEGDRSASLAREGAMQKARSAYMEARIAYAASQGRTLYPDANGSLRFTYGKVTGKARDGLRWDAFTTAKGILEKQTGREPFDAPDKTIAALKAGDFGRYASPELNTLPVNYLSTVDITNGNSGSSTLNARGEFVGLAFDMTLEGVISDWWYDPAINRSIHVDSRYMLWTMDKVDGATRLLDEMGVAR